MRAGERVDRQLRIGADRRREQRPVAARTGCARWWWRPSTPTTDARGSAAERRAAHHVRRHDARVERTQVERVDRGLRRGEARERRAVAVDGRRRCARRPRTGSPPSRETRAARRPTRTASADSRAPACRRRAGVPCRRRFAAWKPSRSSAITTCMRRKSRIHCACATPSSGSVIAVSSGCIGGASSLNPIGPSSGSVVEEVIGVDRSAARRRSRRSRSGMSAAETTVGMQERALADERVRIGHAAAQQQRGRADRARRRDEGARAHGDPARRRRACRRASMAKRFERRDPVAREDEAMRAHARDERRAAIERRGDRRDQHRLLGVGRAAHAAVAEVPAALHVAADRGRERCRACAAPRASAALFALGATSHGAIDSRASIRANHGAIASAEKPRKPYSRCPVGKRGRRRAERARPVDRRAAADAAALQDVDRLVRGLARRRFLVEVGIRLALVHAEVARRAQRPFLEQHDAKPGAREDLRRGAAAGAAADDDDVGFEREVALRARGVDRPSSRRDACPTSIGIGDAVMRALERGRARIADRRPRIRVAVPRGERELVQARRTRRASA